MTVATAVKSRPIIMSAPSVRAILDDRKTQTRRVVKPQPQGGEPRFHELGRREVGEWYWYGGDEDSPPHMRCPYGVPGDLLWVREGFITGWPTEGGDVQYCDEDGNDLPEHIWYRSDCGYFPTHQEPTRRGCRSDRGAFITGWTDEDGGCRDNIPWKSPLYMPRKYARLWLRVVKVRVERVQEISGPDALCEGVLGIDESTVAQCDGRWASACAEDAKRAFAVIWDSLNAKRGFSWDSNPWVWAVTFERAEKPA